MNDRFTEEDARMVHELAEYSQKVVQELTKRQEEAKAMLADLNSSLDQIEKDIEKLKAE